MDESLLRISGAVYGDATGRLGSTVSSTGNIADFLAQCDVHDGDAREVFHYNSSVHWDVPAFEEGHVLMTSELRMYTNPTDFPMNVSYCAPYETSETDYAMKNYSICYITACSGQTIKASLCSGECSGDTYLRLYDASGILVADNDDVCGLCSEITYDTDIDACEVYSLHEGCYGMNMCSGQAVVEVYNTSESSHLWDTYMSTTWDILGSLNYKNSLYDFIFQERNYEGSENFYLVGNGAYGGSFYEWCVISLLLLLVVVVL